MPFGPHVRLWRQQRGLNQQELADLLSINRVTLARWETEQTKPDDVSSLVATLRRLQREHGESETPTTREVAQLWA
jgi:transcriptional regulator with XRE-family HTH domain